MFALEHRYYGDSLPFDSFTTENLKYLTSQQALADLSVFIQTINEKRNFVNSKWIVFGGSYPGMLAACPNKCILI
uniref:Uncharacterized protein n=1 Tax=Ditylenchus dipsaci TaxID=166011 RepID=A0A915DQR4_9BILA